MGQASSFRFALTHPVGETNLVGGLVLDEARGAFVSPDSLAISADTSMGRLFVEVEAVAIGDDAWVTNPLTGEWVDTSAGDSLFAFFDPSSLVANILGLVRDIEYASVPVAGGAVVLNAAISAYALSDLVGEVVDTNDLELEIRLDADTFALKRVRISGQIQEADGPDAVRVIEITDLNSEIVIEPPT